MEIIKIPTTRADLTTFKKLLNLNALNILDDKNADTVLSVLFLFFVAVLNKKPP